MLPLYHDRPLSSQGHQVIHGTTTLGKPKVESARDRMLDVNPHITVEAFHEQLTSENALRILDGYDVVIYRRLKSLYPLAIFDLFYATPSSVDTNGFDWLTLLAPMVVFCAKYYILVETESSAG